MDHEKACEIFAHPSLYNDHSLYCAQLYLENTARHYSGMAEDLKKYRFDSSADHTSLEQ